MPRSRFLSEKSYRILESFAIISLGTEQTGEIPLAQAEFRSRIEFVLQKTVPQVKWFFSAALWIFELIPLFLFLRPFSGLSRKQQDRFFKKWHGSRSYLLYLPMKILLTMVYTAYYSHPKVASNLGFRENLPSPLRGEGQGEGGHGVTLPPTPSPQGRGDSLKELEVEICVIGSGAGGAVVAKELAEKGHEVLILEEGGYFGRDDFRRLSTLERNRLIYRDSGLFTTLGIPMILLPTGKCVGGTTVINSGTCFRTPDEVLKKWQNERGLASLTPQAITPYFEKVEKTLYVQPVPDAVFGGNDRVVLRGVQILGLHGSPLMRNAPGCQGSGVCIFGCPTGAKQSMEQSYLPLAFKAGAKLYPHCHVTRLVCKNERVEKIEAVFTNPQTGRVRSRLTVRPQKVVAACGTIFSPLLLKRSGLAAGSRALGKNLTLHPTAKMVGLFDETVDGFKGVPQASGITDFEPEGMMCESVFFPPWLLATSTYHAQEELREIMQAYRRLVIYGFLVHDEGRGSVREGIAGRPLVLYSLGEREKELFVKGLKILGRVFFAAGAKKVYPTIRTISSINSPAELEKLDSRHIRASELESAAFHPLGTCRMGLDPRDSVVNEEMRVHGMENLWIADGSVFPTSLGVNPQITIMAFAARCADIIHQGL